MTRAIGSTEEFLKHRTQAPRGNMLTKWTDGPAMPGTNPPMPGVNTVLMRRDYAYILWRHQLPKVQVKSDGSKEIWSQQLVCWEDEEVLLSQFRRYDDERRRRPPQKCGVCRLVEWTYQQIAEEKLSWTAPVFRFDDGNETRVLRAGGITNLFGRNDLTDGEKAQLKKHGIFPREAWKESMWAKAQYLFCLVDYNDPNQGAQVAIVSQLLGSKVQKVIADRQASLGVDAGDPSKHPFVIQWLADPGKSVPFNEKYHARPIDSLKITPEIDALVSGEPLDVEFLTRRFNALELRAALEDAAEIEFPWDELFGKLEGGQARAQQEIRGDAQEVGRVAPPDARSAPSAPPSAPPKAADVEEAAFDCDTCGKPVADSDKKCPHCGAVFEAEEPPPPPVRPRRTAIAPAQQAAPQGPPPNGGGGPSVSLPVDEDDIPFVYCEAGSMGAERWWPR